MCLVVLSNAQYEMLWSGLSLQVGGRLLGVFKLMLSLARTYVCMYVLLSPFANVVIRDGIVRAIGPSRMFYCCQTHFHKVVLVVLVRRMSDCVAVHMQCY